MSDLMKKKLHTKALSLVVLAAIAMPISQTLVQAQDKSASPSPTLAIPDSLPADTKIKVDGDTSMKGINALLKSKLESKFSGSKVDLAESTSSGALKALEEGKLDIAAIGRPLTEDEKAKGFTEVPVAFNKIGIFTNAENPFAGSLTNAQFAKIFRGEITNWSQVGGPDAPIVLVDRPDSSDTRASFARYPVFKEAAFAAGSTAAKLDADTNEAVITKLGKTGIGYALAEQVTGKSGLKIVPLHKVLPDDQRYSFSQPLAYVYKTMTPAVQAFLGLAQDPNNLPDIEAARKAGVSGGSAPVAATAMNAPKSSESPASGEAMAPTAVAQAPSAGEVAPGFNWWLLPLLGIPLLGAAILLLKPKAAPIAAVPVAAAGLAAGTGALKSRLIAVPRDCKNGYAYWEIDEIEAREIRSQGGGKKLAMRLYDVTNDDLKRPDRNQFIQFDLSDRDTDLHFPIHRDDRDYMTELGYLNSKNEWLRVATSDVVHCPSCDLEAATDRSRTQTTARPGEAAQSFKMPSLPDVNLPNLGNIGGFVAGGIGVAGAAVAGMMNRGNGVEAKLPDVSIQTPDVELPEVQFPEVSEPDIMRIAPNLPDVNLPDVNLPDLKGAAVAGAAAIGGLTAAALGRGDSGETSVGPTASHIILVPRDKQSAYAYWELNSEERARAIAEGGQQFVLRVSDAHGQVIDGQNQHSFRQYDLSAEDSDHHFHLPATDRDYIAEVGYLTRDQRWIGLARSTAVYCGDNQST
jgi:phosphate transport system substrate-binding protein